MTLIIKIIMWLGHLIIYIIINPIRSGRAIILRMEIGSGSMSGAQTYQDKGFF